MNDKQHVYVTYIASTADKVWKALTDADAMRRYWGGVNESEFKPGSRWQFRLNGDPKPALGGTIVESDPPRRLVMTWAAMPDDQPDKRSRVTFELETKGDVVRLTVTHAELDPVMAESVNGGWPRVLSSLKSLLETGNALSITCKS